MAANLRQSNEGKPLAQSCYAVMRGMAVRDGSLTRHVLAFIGERANHYTTAPREERLLIYSYSTSAAPVGVGHDHENSNSVRIGLGNRLFVNKHDEK